MKINPNILRKKVIDMVYDKKSGHIGGAFSMAELTSVLYEDYDIGGKDKLILSKGHAVPIIYAVLHETGQITDEELNLFREIDSPLQGHPDKLRLQKTLVICMITYKRDYNHLGGIVKL